MIFVDSSWTRIYFLFTGIMGAALNFSLLTVLLCCKNTMGTYRLLMGIYVSASLAYSIYNLFVQPVMLINESGWLLYASGLRGVLDPLTGSVITSSFCTLASILIASLSFSYMLRYLTICRQEGGTRFIRQHILGSFTVVFTIILTASIAATGFFYLLPNTITNMAFKESFKREFGKTIDDASYFGCITYVNGTMYPIFMVTFGIRAGICIFSTLVMIFGGIGILLHLREQAQMMSELAPFIKKQKKVFTLLLLQSFTPIVTFYIPLGLSFIVAIGQWNLPYVSRAISIILPISTVIDPILIYLNVSQYRQFLYYTLHCQKLDNSRQFDALPGLRRIGTRNGPTTTLNMALLSSRTPQNQ